MIPRAAPILVAGLLAACSVARLNYTDPLAPRYAGGAPAAAARADTLTVVAFNLQNAQHVDRAIRLLTATEALHDAGVLLLQEMDEPGTRLIAEALGLEFVYYPSVVSSSTHRDFGNAILSRYPIEMDRKILLPHRSRLRHTQRAAVGATIRIGETRVRIYSVHLATMVENGPGARREQLAAVLEDAERYPRVILGGDFNSGSVPEIALASGFVWPTSRLGGTRAIWDMDHVLVRGLELAGEPAVGKVRDVRGASDHRPVWARVLIPPADGDPPGAGPTSGLP